MKKVFISACDIVTGLGSGLDYNFRKLMAGETAIDAIGHFDTGRLLFHKASVAKHVRERNPESVTLALALEAVRDLPELPRDTMVIWAGVKSDAEYVEAEAAYGSNIPYLPEHYIEALQTKLNLSGDHLSCNAACAASTVAISLAAQMISSGQRNSVLVVAADLASRFTHTGFSALRALSPTDCRPFDENRDGLCLGDGAVAIWMTDGTEYPRLAEIAGWGVANDANHITGPARDGCGLIAAIEQALRMSDTGCDSVEAFCAHGTGTVYNDAMELTAIETVFGDRKFPVFGIKGAIGHTMGAAGAIEVALCTKILEGERIPPTCGVLNLEPRAVERVSYLAQTFPGHNILTTNSGFGGVNAAIILKHTDADKPLDRDSQSDWPDTNAGAQTNRDSSTPCHPELSQPDINSPCHPELPFPCHPERSRRTGPGALHLRVLGGSWISAAAPAMLNQASSFEFIDGELQLPPARGLFTPPLVRYGRFDPYTKTGLAAMALALKDAGLDEFDEKRDIGVILSTHWESLDTDRKYHETTLADGGIASSPNLFSYTLPNVVIGECAAYYKLMGPTFTVNETGDRGGAALKPALDMIEAGLSGTIVVGWLDSPPESMLTGVQTLPQRGALYIVFQRAAHDEKYDYQYINGFLSDPDGGTFSSLTAIARDQIQKKG